MKLKFRRSGPPLTAGAALWREIVEIGGLEEEGWDAPLAATLRSTLGLGHSRPIIEELADAQVDADALIRAFLMAAEPYVAMWGDLLAMLQRAGATRGDQVVEIDYHFGAGEDPDVRFDLDHFRTAQRLVTQAMNPFDLREIDATTLWAISEPLADPPGGRKSRDLSPWAEQFWTSDTTWPDSLPPGPPSVPNERLQAVVNELWDLAAFLLAEVRSVSQNRAELRASRAEQTSADGRTPTQLLFDIENDMWIGAVVERLQDPALRMLTDVDADALADTLDRPLERCRNDDTALRRRREQTLDLLALPLWKHRYELFSNWVCTVVIDALDDLDPIIHAVDGAIHFRSTGTHLATFEGLSRRLHLLTELQTPLARPRGAGRKANIRPDISLVFDPLSEPIKSPVVIECKQYKRASNAAFADALADYANGRPGALVVLAGHGPVREEAVLARLGADIGLSPRIKVIDRLDPGNRNAIAELTAEIRAKLGPSSVRRTTPVRDPVGHAAEIHLAWDDPSVDLDLHVQVVPRTGEPVEICYSQPGKPDRPPHIYLLDDIRAGGSTDEVVVVQRWTPGASYRIEVHAYSPVRIADCNAAVAVVANGEIRMHTSPPEAERVWTVQVVDAPDTGST